MGDFSGSRTMGSKSLGRSNALAWRARGRILAQIDDGERTSLFDSLSKLNAAVAKTSKKGAVYIEEIRPTTHCRRLRPKNIR